MNSMQTSIEAVRKSVVVNCDVERAFEVFTREIGSWWPLDTHSIGQHQITEVVFEEKVGGRVFERHENGGEGEWGRVLVWEPPARFVMSWYPGKDASQTNQATELEVRFRGEGDATHVDLEHRGWEVFAEEAEETRSSYDGGWGTVLGFYERKLSD
jgi:uncharacterized protein YndB with AHSA1/START domain